MLIEPVMDQLAVDKKGNPIYLDAQTPNRARAVPRVVPHSSDMPTTTTSTNVMPATTTSGPKRARVYGWNRVIWLAEYEPEKVRRTPEAYMIFAMAVYYTQINKRGLQFSYGYALYFGEHESED